MVTGCPAHCVGRPWLPHYALVLCKHLIRRPHPKTCHDVVVGGALVRHQLLPTIFQRVHAHVLVKSQLINTMLAFHLPVMPRRCNPNAVILNPHLHQCFLKQRFVLGFRYQQRIGKLGPVIRLDHSNRERRHPNQLLQKFFRTGSAMHTFPVTSSGTLVFGGELIVLFPIHNAIAWRILHVYLHLLSGILGMLIRLVLLLFRFFVLGWQLLCCLLKAVTAAIIAVFACFLITENSCRKRRLKRDRNFISWNRQSTIFLKRIRTNLDDDRLG